MSIPQTPFVGDAEETEERPKEGHVKIIFTGPVAPHWEYRAVFGEKQLIEDFKLRAQARLMLLSRDDPQFRRNCERIIRDAERHDILLEWDLGYTEEELEEDLAES